MGFGRTILGSLVSVIVGCGGAPLPGDDAPLRVGTTGDIAPYSMSTENGGYEGMDIDLARDLGRTIGRPVIFVGTTWGTLVDDAVAYRFDLALSAISVTEERARRVDFSHFYAEHASVAVVRCEDQSLYASLEDLDRPSVTIFARAAGVNAMCIRNRFPNAEVRAVEDLSTAFARLVAGEGDIIADTSYERRHHRGLCVALDGMTFNPSVLAALLPKGSPLLDTVNEWLEQRLADGTVGRLRQHYGAP